MTSDQLRTLTEVAVLLDMFMKYVIAVSKILANKVIFDLSYVNRSSQCVCCIRWYSFTQNNTKEEAVHDKLVVGYCENACTTPQLMLYG